MKTEMGLWIKRGIRVEGEKEGECWREGEKRMGGRDEDRGSDVVRKEGVR